MKIALIGYGRMGRSIEKVAATLGHEVVATFRSKDVADGGISRATLNGAQVGFEFTEPGATVANVERATRAGLDLVVGTTGWYEKLEAVTEIVTEAGTGLLYAPNFSLGTQLFFRLCRLAARLSDRLGGYDAYVLEAHHRHKRDHPSGTARRLAELLLGELSGKERWSDRLDQGPIDPSTLQVASVRAGENPGLHVMGLDGPDDRIELRHQAAGREGFAGGAVRAGEWVQGRSGVFTLDDMLVELLGREMT